VLQAGAITSRATEILRRKVSWWSRNSRLTPSSNKIGHYPASTRPIFSCNVWWAHTQTAIELAEKAHLLYGQMTLQRVFLFRRGSVSRMKSRFLKMAIQTGNTQGNQTSNGFVSPKKWLSMATPSQAMSVFAIQKNGMTMYLRPHSLNSFSSHHHNWPFMSSQEQRP